MAPTLRLAIELVADILRRLPAKSLVRFRSVSKEWSSLCFDPSFQKLLHQNHHDWKLIARDGLLYSLDLGSLDCALRTDHLLQDSNFTVKKALGCSNGRICLSVSDNNANPVFDSYPKYARRIPPVELNADIIVICDLSTGARRIVPPSPVDFKVESFAEVPLFWVTVPPELGGRCDIGVTRRFSYGFGFDPSGDDYKLVRISQYLFDGDSIYKDELLSEAKVYSMKTNSWHRVELDMSSSYINDGIDAALVEGVLYWVAGGFPYRWESRSDMVVAFDLAEESFHGIVPEESDLLCLGSMGGELFVLGRRKRIDKLSRVEGHGDVWTTWASFARSPWPFETMFDLERAQAMTFSKNGDKVLFVQRQKVLLDNVDIGFVFCDLAKEQAGTCQLKFVSMNT